MIVFDLDGTLIDSSRGIYLAYRDACLAHKLKNKTYNQFKAIIGPPFPKMFKTIHPNENSELSYIICNKFAELYSQKCYYSNFDLRENTESVLSKLFSCYSMSILTNKKTAIARSIIEASNISSFFEFIAGRDFYHESQTKYDVLKRMLENNVIPSGSTYVGDTNDDRQMSISLGLKFIGLVSLFTDKPLSTEYASCYDGLVLQLSR